MYSIRYRAISVLAFLLIITVDSLWPLPHDFQSGSEALWLQANFSVVCEDPQPLFGSYLQTFQAILRPSGNAGSEILPSCEDARLHSAVRRAHSDIVSHAFVPWKFNPKHVAFEPARDATLPTITFLKVKQTRLAFSDDEEAYELIVASDGAVLIQFNHPLGAVRALNTFTQLIYHHSHHSQAGQDSFYMKNAPVHIQDYPFFKHRGLNLDISRNLVTPRRVIETLEAMAFNKFNHLHLHASDAQSWPLEIPSLPELAREGAYHQSQIWTATDLRAVQDFGAERGIQVYLELDMPGHTASIVHAYPELIQSFNRKPWQIYSAQPPSGQLKLSNPNVTAFIALLLNDLLPRVTAYSSLFHLGGDEITPAAYDMTAVEMQPYLQEFVDHAISLVHSHALTPVVWEEHVLDYNLTLPADTVIQTWRASNANTPSSLARVTALGHKALFGANDHWYLDCGHGNWVDPDTRNPDSVIKRPFLDYCGPYHNWREVYSYDPLADVPAKQQHLVIGGEVSMWGEQTDGMNLDSRLWPRLSAAGEMLWHGSGIVSENVTSRLGEMREWLVSKEIAVGPVQVTWCLMNPGNCIA